jgi:hypothetical protein
MILAYIDPGSGSILIQVILATCIGGIAVFWTRIKSLFDDTGKKPTRRQEARRTQEAGITR